MLFKNRKKKELEDQNRWSAKMVKMQIAMAKQFPEKSAEYWVNALSMVENLAEQNGYSSAEAMVSKHYI